MVASMVVKIRRRVAKRRYYHTVYKYERFFIEIPSEYYEDLKSFLDKELDIHITRKKNQLVLRLSPQQRPRKS
jgi:hypothetical protein